ncbi:hypothetical protein H6A07_09005 [Olsenella uli]|uniref:hypothetical protein n=1 Tax=Olsenella uli TaxID=133926 RepID=UPI0019579A4E|nr:hypothetical protein [Olsenella uli]MBM6676872.1 hypothetical protein [Olsenella uli]
MVDHSHPRIRIGSDGTIRMDDKDKKKTNVQVRADGTIHVGDAHGPQTATSQGVTQGDFRVLTCPNCGERLRAIEPNRDVTVEIDCPRCHKTSFFHLTAVPGAAPTPAPAPEKKQVEKGNGCLVSLLGAAFLGVFWGFVCGVLGIPLPPDIVGWVVAIISFFYLWLAADPL